MFWSKYYKIFILCVLSTFKSLFIDDKIQEFGENGQDKPKKVKRAGPVNRGKLYESLIFLNET